MTWCTIPLCPCSTRTGVSGLEKSVILTVPSAPALAKSVYESVDLRYLLDVVPFAAVHVPRMCLKDSGLGRGEGGVENVELAVGAG